jgi:hypothetical protein
MKKTLMLLVLPLLASSLVAQEIPMQTWANPPTFKPAGSIGAMADISPGIPFVAVTPCRVYDSRSATILPAGGTRVVPMAGATCGLPSGAEAYSIHVTAFASTPSTSYGFITIYPAGTTRPVVSTMNFLGGSQTSSAAVVPAGSGFDISVYTTMSTHFVIDVNGYYTAKFPTTNQFVAESTSAAAAILGLNNTAAAGAHAIGGYAGGAALVHGIQGQTGGASLAGSSGVHGIADANSQPTYGVFGQSASGASNAAGVFGHDKYGPANSTGYYIAAGVRGESSDAAGVAGISNYIAVFGAYHDEATGDQMSEGGLGWGTTGVYATAAAAGATAIEGHAIRGTGGGMSYGVLGTTSSIDNGSVGVMGSHRASWTLGTACGSCTAGVRGLAANAAGFPVGVSGEGTGSGVLGVKMSAAGALETWGVLGYSGTEGVYTPNHLTASGGKSFIEPHPREAGRTIRYESLEGPEHGTYFRGRGQFVGRTAVLAVPDYFALVSSPDDLSIQVTPIGDLAQVAVTYIGLDRIELKSSRDVEFFFTVNGIRQALPRSRTIEDDQGYFIPRSADDRIEFRTPYPEMQKRLIASGIYNMDGSVNMMTAERMGWAQQWREAEEAAKAAAAAEQQPPSLSTAGSTIR